MFCLYLCRCLMGAIDCSRTSLMHSPSPPLDNIRVMVIVWRLRGNIIRTALWWIVWHNVHSQKHTYRSSSYRSNRLGLSHWDPYAVHRGGCLELYYCDMVEWFWWDSSLISTTNWFPSVLWHCCFGHLACKNRPQNDLLCVEWDVKPYTLTQIWSVLAMGSHILPATHTQSIPAFTSQPQSITALWLVLIAPTDGGMARLSRLGWLVIYCDRFPALRVEPQNGHPSQYQPSLA